MDSSGRKHILVVDDEADTLELVSELLTHAGFAVSTANGWSEALSICKEERFDLVVTDYRMPRMSGSVYLRALRERIDDTPVIVVTGAADEATAVVSDQAHERVAILSKPFSSETLVRKVFKAMEAS